MASLYPAISSQLIHSSHESLIFKTTIRSKTTSHAQQQKIPVFVIEPKDPKMTASDYVEFWLKHFDSLELNRLSSDVILYCTCRNEDRCCLGYAMQYVLAQHKFFRPERNVVKPKVNAFVVISPGHKILSPYSTTTLNVLTDDPHSPRPFFSFYHALMYLILRNQKLFPLAHQLRTQVKTEFELRRFSDILAANNVSIKYTPEELFIFIYTLLQMKWQSDLLFRKILLEFPHMILYVLRSKNTLPLGWNETRQVEKRWNLYGWALSILKMMRGELPQLKQLKQLHDTFIWESKGSVPFEAMEGLRIAINALIHHPKRLHATQKQLVKKKSKQHEPMLYVVHRDNGQQKKRCAGLLLLLRRLLLSFRQVSFTHSERKYDQSKSVGYYRHHICFYGTHVHYNRYV